MKAFLFLTALCATACSGSESPGNAQAVPAPRAATPVANAPAVPTERVRPTTPGQIKTFRDWAVGCDNALRCTMASLGPEQGELPAHTVALARTAGPDGEYALTVDAQGDGATTPTALVIDDKRFVMTRGAVSGDNALRAAAALAKGTALTIESAEKTRISLAGAAAALRYVDAMQGRAGTVTATVAKGSVPASRVPVASTLPTIRVVTAQESPATPIAAQLADMRRAAQCEDGSDDLPESSTPQVYALGQGKTLVMLPCSIGAYNVTAALFILANDTVVRAQTDAAGTDGVVNGEFRDGILSSYAKGRGVGDCGIAQRFAWDGERFRLIEQSEMSECRGNPNFITIWRANTVPR